MTQVSTFRPTTRPIAGTTSAVVLLMALAAACGAAAKDPLNAPAVAPLTVDGDAADWTGVPTVYLEQGPRVTAVAHDDTVWLDVALAPRESEGSAP